MCNCEFCDLTDWGEEDCCCCGTKGQWLLFFVILCSLGKTSGGSGLRKEEPTEINTQQPNRI
jgi:hypothetical protein